VKQSARIEREIKAVEDFRHASRTLLDTIDAEERAVRQSRSPRSPEPDPPPSPELREKRRIAGELAGPAGIAAERVGIVLRVQDPAVIGGRQTTINPIAAWSAAIDGTSLHIGPQDVLDSCAQAIGRLRQQKADAEANERSLAGRFARFIRFPWDVRERLNLPAESAGQKAAFGAAVAAQVIGTLIAAGILALLARAAAALVG